MTRLVRCLLSLVLAITAQAAPSPNVLFIFYDALRPAVQGCFYATANIGKYHMGEENDSVIGS